jgi:membrane-bound inhibitor of C-type lysozyme
MKGAAGCRSLTWLAIAGAVAGCGADRERVANREVAFQCAGGKEFVAVFEADLDSVVVDIGSQRLRLPHVPAASGAKYSDGTTTFWAKGDQVLLEGAGETYSDCAARQV